MATEPKQIDQAAVFKQLDEYPWDTDRVFQGGLAAILGNNPQPEQIYNLTIRAQCFYLSRKLSIPIDFDAYKEHLTTKPNTTSVSDSSLSLLDNNITAFTTSGSSSTIPTSSASDNDIPASSIPASTSTNVPQSNITAASSIDDSVLPYAPPGYTLPLPPPRTRKDRRDEKREPLPYQIAFARAPVPDNEEKPARRVSADGGAPYPTAFAEIVEKILTGQPIPGIQEFPPVVSNWELAGKPGKLPIRRKPWEEDDDEEQTDSKIGLFGDHRDIYIPQDLPEA